MRRLPKLFPKGLSFPEKMEETDEMELGNLNPQVIDSIFSRIPLKSLAKLKLVSKTWNNFIKHFRRCYPPTTTSGLIILLKNISDHEDFQESKFIRIQERQEGFCFSTSTHACIKHNFPVLLIDSCNGLLLYATHDSLSLTYYVCSPFFDQCLALPRAHDITRLAGASLVFDASMPKNFRVLCFFLEEFDLVGGTIGCKIFSSETWDWRVFQARILNIDLLLKSDLDFHPELLFGSSVFCRGRLYWIWSCFMLVYDNQGEFFKLLKLPMLVQSELDMFSHLLWESEGIIYFCSQSNEKLCIYRFIGDDEVLDEDQDFLWQVNPFVALEGYILRELDFMVDGKLKKLRAKFRIWPCAFNQDLQLLYLHVPPRTIFSYSLETRELKQVWVEETCAIVGILPFLFKSVDLFPPDLS